MQTAPLHCPKPFVCIGSFGEGRLNGDVIYAVMSEVKTNQKEKLKIPAERVRKFFPKDYTAAQMEEEIVKMCESRYRKRQRDSDSG